MGLFSKLFQGPEIDQAKSDANRKKMRALFNQVVENGDAYQLIFGFTEDVSRFNYGLVRGSKSKIGNLIVGWDEAAETIVAVPTVPDLSLCITAALRSTRRTGTSIPPTPLSSTPTGRATSASTPTTGWRTNRCTSMSPRRRS